MGMSDGTMTLEKKKTVIWYKDERCWLKRVSKDTVTRQFVEMRAGYTN